MIDNLFPTMIIQEKQTNLSSSITFLNFKASLVIDPKASVIMTHCERKSICGSPLMQFHAIVFCYSVQVEKNYISQSAFTCSKLTIETLEQRVKYVQS